MEIRIAIGKVAKYFGVSTQTIRNWTQQGKFKEYRTLGGHRRYNIKELFPENGEEKKTILYSRVSEWTRSKRRFEEASRRIGAIL